MPLHFRPAWDPVRSPIQLPSTSRGLVPNLIVNSGNKAVGATLNKCSTASSSKFPSRTIVPTTVFFGASGHPVPDEYVVMVSTFSELYVFPLCKKRLVGAENVRSPTMHGSSSNSPLIV